MDNITEIIVTGAASAGTVGSILGYFLKRIISDIDNIKATLNGIPGDAKSQGLVALVQENKNNDENREIDFKELKGKVETYLANNPQTKIDKAVNELRHEIELKYRKK